MNEILNQISKIGIVPVVKIDNAKDAVPLAKALINGGLPCAEVTFRTAAAEEAISLMAKEFPEMLLPGRQIPDLKLSINGTMALLKKLILTFWLALRLS